MDIFKILLMIYVFSAIIVIVYSLVQNMFSTIIVKDKNKRVILNPFGLSTFVPVVNTIIAPFLLFCTIIYFVIFIFKRDMFIDIMMNQKETKIVQVKKDEFVCKKCGFDILSCNCRK